MMINYKPHKIQNVYFIVLICAITILLLQGCAGKKDNLATRMEKSKIAKSKVIADINQKLNLASGSGISTSRVYRVGPGDVLSILVFQVAELSREYEVNSDGEIQVPLLGRVSVKGQRVEEIQIRLTRLLGENLLRDPQVTVDIKEYSSQQITIAGAVGRPDIYYIKRGRNVYELLTKAGGFSNDAGSQLYIKTTQPNQSTGDLELKTIVIEIEDMFNPSTVKGAELQSALKKLILSDGDTIFVPKAGVVYVDGAVKGPGQYKLNANTTVLQILAQAGGVQWESTERKVRILRNNNGNVNVIEVNVDKVRDKKEPDVILKDGDVVTVGYNAFKLAVKGFFDYVLRLMVFF